MDRLKELPFLSQLSENLGSFLQKGNYKRILASYPLKDEPDILSILVATGLPIYMPLIGPEGKMEFRRQIEKGESRSPEIGHLSIPGAQAISPLLQLPLESEDLILIPTLACDSNGTRLGRGGGYYDRWKKEMEWADRLALLPEILNGLEFPGEVHDLRLTHIITETRIQVYKNESPKIY